MKTGREVTPEWKKRLRVYAKRGYAFDEIPLTMDEFAYWKELTLKDRKSKYKESIEFEEEREKVKKEKQEGTIKNLTEKSKFDISEDERREVLTKIATQQKAEATELIVKIIESKEKIYSIRSEEHQEIYAYRGGIYLNIGKSLIQEYSRDILGEAYTTQIYSNVLSKILADTFTDAEEFFTLTEKSKIAVVNGILDLKTRELLPFNPNIKLFNKLPVVFDKSKECPRIKAFFSTIHKEEKSILLIQELFGFCLYPDLFIKKTGMLYGDGNNGKGAVLILLKHLLGLDNISNISLQDIESDDWALGEMVNKLANLVGDISKDALKGTGNFKLITGKDQISARRKYLNRIKTTIYAKQIFSANELPVTYDLTSAFFDRWIIIDFPFKFISKEEYDQVTDKSNIKIKDNLIIEKLITQDELSGLLNWALIGLKRLLDNGNFSDSESTEAIRKRWVRRSGSFNAFCQDYLEEKWDGKISKDEMRKAYSHYCREHRLNSSSDVAIKTILSSMGVAEGRPTIEKKTIASWEGVVFKSELGLTYECKDEKSCKGCLGCEGFSTYIKISNSTKGKIPSQGSHGTQDAKIYVPAPTPQIGMCHQCRQHSPLTHTTFDSDVGSICQSCAEG